ncbi:MAG: AMP-binding protein [Planctomycetota bacterium]|nr:AMP-binding protein [Planctomycetota bacterium]
MSADLRLQLERVYHWEKNHPDRIQFTQPVGGGVVKEMTWKQVVDQARRMAAYLRAQDFPEKSHIAIFSKNTAYWIIADLAIWMAGHVSIPLYPTLAPDTIKYILEHSESKMVFVGKLDGFEGMKAGLPDDLPKVAMPLSPKTDYKHWDEILKENEPISDSPTRDSEDMATMVYTSGSTGRPKGVMVSFKAMAASAQGVGSLLQIHEGDRMLSYLPLAHVLERMLVETHSLIYGFKVFFAESLTTFVEDLRRASPTLFVSVPRLWLKFQLGVFKNMPAKKLAFLLKIPILSGIVRKKVLTKLGLQNVRFAGSGSAPIPPELIQWYNDLGLELLEAYGMSENFAFSHCSKPGMARVGFVGNVYPGVEHKISEEGEILVKSPATMMGYYKLPDKSAESFTEDGFLKTGDRGEIDEKGRLKITGRVKELFKTSKGKYVAPAPIENKLLVSPLLEAACVAGSGHPQPHAVVMLAEDLRPKQKDASARIGWEKELVAHLDAVNAKLDHHEQMQFIAIVNDVWSIEDGFLTPTMKIKRNVVEETYKPHLETWYGKKAKVIWMD